MIPQGFYKIDNDLRKRQMFPQLCKKKKSFLCGVSILPWIRWISLTYLSAEHLLYNTFGLTTVFLLLFSRCSMCISPWTMNTVGN